MRGRTFGIGGSLTLLVALGAAACASDQAAREAAAAEAGLALDGHSRAEPEKVRVTHVALDLVLDFDARRIEGSAELSLVRADPVAPLRLDANGLEILSVRGSDGAERDFSLGPRDEVRGSLLEIELAPIDQRVRVDYRTTAEADALQWLAPEQTAGGAVPFLYTQGQSIFTRTWIPLQDSPQVRVTFDARVRAPEGLTVVMAAEQKGRQSDGSFLFRMAHPIPPYLIALAAGDLAFRAISPRCGIWAEPGVVDAARAELSDTEAMIQAAEGLFGPYRWGRYDILVLPPSFPFGGMENPRLTFATPTILAGDKSLVALVAHELAHSWSGNLVTNATWRDFWLNEGTTVYCEQRIMEAVFGEERSNTEKVLDRADLERELASLEPRDQILYVDLEGRHPDDGFSAVPYQKGALLLRRLEEIVGRADFDRFLKTYFDEHAFQGMTTPRFEAYVRERLLAGRPEGDSIDLRRWLYEPGLPEDAPTCQAAPLQAVNAELARWHGGAAPSELATADWTTQQWLHFLAGLDSAVAAEPDSAAAAESVEPVRALDADAMAALDQAFGFTASGNSEILCAWLRLAIAREYAAVDQRLEAFLLEVGRRKFLKPIYAELAKTPPGLERARAIYARARPRYHAVSTGTIDELLGWS